MTKEQLESLILYKFWQEPQLYISHNILHYSDMFLFHRQQYPADDVRFQIWLRVMKTRTAATNNDPLNPPYLNTLPRPQSWRHLMQIDITSAYFPTSQEPILGPYAARKDAAITYTAGGLDIQLPGRLVSIADREIIDIYLTDVIPRLMSGVPQILEYDYPNL